MKLSEFDYTLPENFIAQFPTERRDYSNLMILDRKAKSIRHETFYDIVKYFSDNDVLVINNTKVIPARLFGKKATGGHLEVFLLNNKDSDLWSALIRPSKRIKEGMKLYFGQELKCEIFEGEEPQLWNIKFFYEGKFDEILVKLGRMPLPPYIKRKDHEPATKVLDQERYQTVYAQKPGSVAAPTAGLHFTKEIMEKIRQKGVQICNVTLNVGLGTFKPVKTENILDHKIHSEYYEIPENTCEIIKEAKKLGKKIIAVGTTTTRTLETAFSQEGEVLSKAGWSNLFIYPGYKFKIIDKLITNFHLPKSTLLMLVAGFAGRNFIFESYRQAIENNYRFYSYGDCMFIH
jgi:S-adenosylmethionine:tRNA ribosyltransferase-isomerase